MDSADSSPTGPPRAEVPPGSAVVLDASATLIGRQLLSGGSPWRLVRLNERSRQLVEAWRHRGVVGPGEGAFARSLVERGLLNVVASPVSPDDVDVVVPSRDDAARVGRLLRQLRGLEVTVVDDGSRDGRGIAREADEAGASLVRLDANTGPAAARNAGLRATSRPFVWFVDSDVTLTSARETASRLRACFEDPGVAAVSARLVGPGGPSVRDGFEARFGALDLGPTSSIVVPHGRVSYVPSACLMVRRDAVGDGFDESMRLGEDVDLVWRLVERGWMVRHVAEAVAFHDARSTWARWFTQRVGYGRSAADLKRRHPEALETVRVDAWTLSTWGLVALGRPRLAAGVAAIATGSLYAQLPDDLEGRGPVAARVALGGIGRAGGPLARAIVRNYAPALVAVAVSRRLRRPALATLALGVAWRWRHSRTIVASDVPLAVADDLAYGVGVAIGALAARQPSTLAPRVRWSTGGLRAVLHATTRAR